MRNQFFYTVTETTKEGKENKLMASFNPDMVIRTIEYESNKLLILLNDFHDMVTERPTKKENGKMMISKQKETVCSEIYLNENDSNKYREMFELSSIGSGYIFNANENLDEEVKSFKESI